MRRIALILLIILAIGVILVVLTGGYSLGWQWTGLAEHRTFITQGEIYEREKTLWDWLGLLIVPAVLAIGALWFNHSQKQLELQIAADKRSEETVRYYLDRISELLLEYNLRAAKDRNEAVSLAQALTISTLRSIDPQRRVLIVKFLHNSGLIEADNPVIELSRIDLSETNFWRYDLTHANLIELDLKDANLRKTQLFGTNLSVSSLIRSNLVGAALYEAQLVGTDLTDADLTKADLVKADLTGAVLKSAILEMASLNNAILIGTDLSKANLRFANLEGTDLTKANLSKADLTGANFSNAYMFGVDLRGAILEEKDLYNAILLDVIR